MKRVRKIRIWDHRYWPLAGLPFAVWLTFSGCSLMVDSNPPAATPSPDVRSYYLPLTANNVEYVYTVTSTAPYHPSNGQLAMSMQGNTDTFQNMPVYACLWTYGNNYGTPSQWYYALCDSQATLLGLEPMQDHYTDSWIDLKADSTHPLQLNATWSFQSQGEQITAKVVGYGSQAKVEGQTYTNVMMVQYTGVNGTTCTEWFAKGVGPIFYHIERPNFGMVENHLLSIKQR